MIVLGVPLQILANANDDHGMGGWEWGMMAVGMVFMLSIITLVVWLIWSGVRCGTRPSRSPRAEEILAERYARGEISREEYEERLSDLRR